VLQGELDMASAPELRARLEAPAGALALVVDLAAVTFIDSAVLKELLRARSELAARDRVEPDFNPAEAAPEGSPFVFNNLQAGQYLAVADRYGSLGLSPAALARQSEVVRERSDQVLADALEFDLAAARRDPPADTCRMVRSEPSGIELPSGGAILRSRGGAPAELTLGRFADMPTAGVGSLAPDRPARLRIPRDTSPEPWRASAAGAGSVEVCGLR
ncbi:MAG: STAS domain-containing protein, partial [Actinomycetota bacterium]